MRYKNAFLPGSQKVIGSIPIFSTQEANTSEFENRLAFFYALFSLQYRRNLPVVHVIQSSKQQIGR